MQKGGARRGASPLTATMLYQHSAAQRAHRAQQEGALSGDAGQLLRAELQLLRQLPAVVPQPLHRGVYCKEKNTARLDQFRAASVGKNRGRQVMKEHCMRRAQHAVVPTPLQCQPTRLLPALLLTQYVRVPAHKGRHIQPNNLLAQKIHNWHDLRQRHLPRLPAAVALQQERSPGAAGCWLAVLCMLYGGAGGGGRQQALQATAGSRRQQQAGRA